jgi:hypothetical protein
MIGSTEAFWWWESHDFSACLAKGYWVPNKPALVIPPEPTRRLPASGGRVTSLPCAETHFPKKAPQLSELRLRLDGHPSEHCLNFETASSHWFDSRWIREHGNFIP